MGRPVVVSKERVEAIAKSLYEAYEELSPAYGFTARRERWELLPAAQKQLARSVVKRLLRRGVVRLVLSPQFSEALQGWPIGWTAIEPLETGSFPLWLHSHSALLRHALRVHGVCSEEGATS